MAMRTKRINVEFEEVKVCDIIWPYGYKDV